LVHRTRAVILSAVAIAAALGLSGCGDDADVNNAEASMETLPPITKPPTVSVPEEAGPTIAPLPPPAALIDVMNRIADPNVPGNDKLNLIEFATPGDAAGMDKFGRALQDGGYAPVTFDAADLRWAEGKPGRVLALVTIKTASASDKDFTFPMEFNFTDNRWQLTRRTADALLHLGEDVPPPPPSLTPPPTPTP
jgi:hypothetical protein